MDSLEGVHGLGDHELLVFLVQLTLLLGVARLLGAAARRLGQPTVIGEVLAGVLLGPTILGRLLPAAEGFVFPADPRQTALLELVSWLGMILLMLRTGIDTDLSRWRDLKGPALLASLLGIAVPFAFGVGVGHVVPAALVGREGRAIFTVFLGTAMSISAVKVIAKILLDLNLLRRDVGFVILGASILDDTIGWIVLAVVIRVAHSGTFGPESVATTLAATAAFAVLALGLLRPLAGRAIRWLEREGRLEHATTSAVVVLTVACGAATQALGIHAIFGAFVAGLLVGESPRVKEGTLDAIDAMVMGVFAPVFFAYSGLQVRALALPAWPVTALVLGGAIVGKVAGAAAGARAGGMRGREALAVGVGLSARGSTELVIARIGMDLGVLAAPVYALIVLLPLVTGVVTPALLRAILRRARPGAGEARRLADEAEEDRSIIPRRGAKVLVPNSGGPDGLQALRLAAPLGRLPGATVVGLSVLTPTADGRRTGRGGRTEEEVVAAVTAVARDFALPDFHASVVSAPSVAEALGDELLRGYDVVFLGLDRRRPLSHRLLRGLLAAGHADVVLVRAEGAARDFRRVLLPVTGAVASRAAAELAFVYSRETGAELQVLHVLDPAAAFDRHGWQEQRLLAGQTVDELVARGRRQGANVQGRLVRSRFPPRAILAAASELRAELVLMGAAPRYSERRAYFGPTADLVLAHAPCAVALYVGGVRPEALRATTPEQDAAPLRPQEERPAAP